MDLKGSSTALDTVVFVLLVGVAVATLVGAGPGGPADPQRLADETADVLATATTEVTVERSGSLSDGSSVSVERRVHGTYAELLAAAAVADPTLDGRSLTGTGTDLERAASNATARALPADEANVQVRATWRPYDGGRLGGTVVVGAEPPPDADVSAAKLVVPSGVSGGVEPETATSYDRVARAVAEGVVAGLFPRDRTRDALASEGPDRAVVATRYRHASAALGVDVSRELEDGEVAAANRRLAAELASLVAADLRREFDSPAAAAEAVATDRVRVVVRTWSP